MDLAALESEMERNNVSPALRDRWREQFRRQNGIETGALLVDPVADERNAKIAEKEEQQKCREMFLEAGCYVYNLSQARESKQTAGLPDLYCVHGLLGIACWFEVKRQKGGELSPEQVEFRDESVRCGILHGVGDRYTAREFIRKHFGVWVSTVKSAT